jgi:nitrite reductase/ring-hydroxylating ferredoxin subunit
MLSREDNALLTQTGHGTAMGAYFRRFWLPALLAEELPEPDGPPVRVSLLGEDLVAFRDSRGRVGLVEARCAHRGASLFFGRNEEGGIRCVYHGWKYDATGACLEAPTLSADAASRLKICLTAYPTREWGDMVWAYLGPAEREPAQLPQLEFAAMPAEYRHVSKKLQQCNWAQAVEGALDTAHFSFLHMPAPASGRLEAAQANADQSRLRWMRDDPMPRFTILEHAAGLVAGAARHADAGALYWRVSQFMLPSHSLAPNALPGELYQGQTFVPIGDDACWIYCYAWNPERPISPEERARLRGGHGVFPQLGEGYVPIRNRDNDYLIDREDQRRRSFTGIRGVSEQDAMIQDSQGLIADRSREHLGPTDAAVIRFRRVMLSAARQLGAGVEPTAASDGETYRLRSGSAVADAALPLEDVLRARFGDDRGRVPAAPVRA